MKTLKKKTLAAAMRPALQQAELTVAVQHAPGKVQVIFPQPVQLMTLSPDQARSLSLALAHHADRACEGNADAGNAH